MLTYLKAGTVKRIHVNRQIIAQNRKNGTNMPALTVQTSKGALRAKYVEILGHSRMEQAGDADGDALRTIKPLSCGARVWVKTTAALEVIA